MERVALRIKKHSLLGLVLALDIDFEHKASINTCSDESGLLLIEVCEVHQSDFQRKPSYQDQMLVEYVQFEVGWYCQIELMRCRIYYSRYGMALRLVEEVDVHHLLTICCIPDMQLLLVVGDERTNVLIVEDILHLPTSSMFRVWTREFMPKLQSLWQHRPIHLRFRSHKLTNMINLLAYARHLTDWFLFTTSFRLSYLFLLDQLRPLRALLLWFSLIRLSLTLAGIGFCSYSLLLFHICFDLDYKYKWN